MNDRPKRGRRSRADWIEAANLAHTLLLLDSARQYGLLEGGPEINVRRCEWTLTRAEALGITPAVDYGLVKELSACQN